MLNSQRDPPARPEERTRNNRAILGSSFKTRTTGARNGLKLWLRQGSFRPLRSQGQALRVPGKNFFLLLEIFSGKKLFARNLDTSPRARFSLYLSQS